MLLREQEQAAGPVRHGADEHHPVAAQRAVGESQPAAGVGHADRQPLLVRPRVAEALEPRRHARVAAGGGDDQVGRERLLGAPVGAPEDAHPCDAPAVRREPEDVAAIDHPDGRQGPHAPPHVALDEGPAGEDRARAGRGAGELVPANDEPHLLEDRALRRPGRDQLAAEPGQQALEAHLSVRQQGVRVAPLGHRPAGRDALGQLVALHHRHPLVRVGQRAGRQQPGHAAADHHRVLADPPHPPPPDLGL